MSDDPKYFVSARQPEKVLLAQVILGRRDPDEAAESLEELARLAETAGMQVMGRMTQRREQAVSAGLVGSGKLEDLRSACVRTRAQTVIFDNELSPAQSTYLAQALETDILDRTALILQIFARRARSAEARAQVELAQLRYLLARVPTTEKQARFRGNIGMKGPGESPLQLRNVPMRRRIRDLRVTLDKIRERRRQAGIRRPCPWISLVGYTNAGKSTLHNALTRAGAYVDDRLFATLDTRQRQLYFERGRTAVLIDTVGFIRNLPHTLVAAFRSTLEVVAQSDLVLVVADAAHPHVADQLQVTLETLETIGAGAVPRVLALNKCDLDAATGRGVRAAADPAAGSAPGAELPRERADAGAALLHLGAAFPDMIPISARTGYGLDRLRETLFEELQRCCSWWQPRSEISVT